MKSLLILWAFLISFGSFAQNIWPHENAEWWMEITNGLFSPTLMHHYIDGDTTIAEISCSVLQSDQIYAYPNDPQNFQTFPVQQEYLHYNGDTLFWWKEDEFRPLICFNAEVGDSWYPLPAEGIWPSCDVQPVFVSAVDSVEYNQEWYRRVYIEGGVGSTDPFYWQGSFDERTFMRGYPYPYYNDCEGVVEWSLYNFRCYSDDELFINVSNGSCSAPLSTTAHQAYEIKLYPNPIRSGQMLQVENMDQFTVFNLNGKALQSEQLDNRKKSEIPINLPAGIYILQLRFANGFISNSKLIVL
ncbi:MAG: T9SS type A sorting domain-containing protein [Cryomorphaceae bacterium]